MSRHGDIDIIPQLGSVSGSSAAQATRTYAHVQHDDEFVPATQQQQQQLYEGSGSGSGSGSSATVTIPANAVKSVMGMSNEYWLIGIIIVLVMVVIMLIVYIVRLKNAEEIKLSQPTSRHAKQQEQEHSRAQEHRNIVNLPTRSVLQDIASAPFTPRSTTCATATAAPSQHSTQEQSRTQAEASQSRDDEEDAQDAQDVQDAQDDADVQEEAHTPPPRASQQPSTSTSGMATID